MSFVQWWARERSLYYGWVVVFACAACILCACPGQSYGVAQFVEYILEDTDMTRIQLAGIWSIVLFLCSLLLPFFGRLCDVHGPHRVLCFAIPPYIILLASMGQVVNLVTFALNFFAMRLVGPGVLVLIGSTTVNHWFHRRRGRAAAVLSIAVGLETLFPALALALIDASGWRHAFAWMALLALCVLLVVAALLRDSPEKEGVPGDGDTEEPAKDLHHVGVSVAEALRFPAFWFCLGAGAMAAVFWTGINLYAVAVFSSKGLEPQHVSESFAMTTFVSLFASAASGVLADSMVRKERLFAISMGFGLLANVALLHMHTRSDALVFGFFYGLFTGSYNTAMMVVYAAQYGRAHLGAISGVAAGVAQICGGGGPLTYSVLHSLTGTYNTAFYIFICGMAAVGALLCAPLRLPDLSRAHHDADHRAHEESASALLADVEETSV